MDFSKRCRIVSEHGHNEQGGSMCCVYSGGMEGYNLELKICNRRMS
jgi:hypothetical protein